MAQSRHGMRWSKEELILAINLYCKIPFGHISARHPWIIELATLLGRTPNSLGLKLGNLAALDTSIHQKGLSHGGTLDKEVWDGFFNDQTESAYKSELLLAQKRGKTIEEEISEEFDVGFPEGREREGISKVRVNQYIFRRAVLTSYQNKCCITGLDIPELLVASHIMPWSTGKDRIHPANGLCLNALHDRAFDKGLITIDNNFRVVVSSRIMNSDIKERKIIKSFHGKKISLPLRFSPNVSYLEYHQQNVFY